MPAPDQPSQIAGRFDLYEIIGRGGAAAVFRAVDRETGETLALKLVDKRRVHQGVLNRFQREAVALRKVEHPNVVAVRAVGRDGPYAYLAMELVKTTAHAMARKQRGLTDEQVLRIASGALNGLSAVHALGWVHRDVKPANLLVDGDGECKIADFGIMRPQQSNLTTTGSHLGTNSYMAPEQRLDPRKVSPAADIYGVGASMFALSTGKVPPDLALLALKARIAGVSTPKNDPLELMSDLLRPIARRACAYDPADRFGSADAMREVIELAMGEFGG